MVIFRSLYIAVLAFISAVYSSKIPAKINDFSKSMISKALMSQLYFVGLGTAKILADDGYDRIYIDQRNKFQINQADGWTLMPREVKNSLSQYMHEEIALVGSNFVEGASLSVTKSRVRQLLKDMKIDWWFDNFKSINDLGSSDLIAELLIRQRQGDFDKKQSPSEISSSVINTDNDSILFEYLTPLTTEVYRRTIVKAYYIPKDDVIICCWMSGLSEIFKDESSYSSTLYEILNSYVLL